MLLALLAGLPGILLGLILLWKGGFAPRTQWTLTLFVVGAWLGFAFATRERVIRPLQTLANLLGALREGDFSVRARGARTDDALGLALWETNTLSRTLRDQRLAALEASALLRAVMQEVDVAVFAFDGGSRLRLVNRAGERLLDLPAARLLGRGAHDVGLSEALLGPASPTLEASFATGGNRWEVRRTAFRLEGRPHQLLVLTDVSRVLRQEERLAWQRLVRVLGHEINNSLAPIRSIAGSLQDLLRREPAPADREADLRQGLEVIAARSAALGRFMAAYARLARLPPPRMATIDVGEWVRRVADYETRVPIRVVAGEPVALRADGDQLEQLLINLVRNAADAALETEGSVEVGWSRNGSGVIVWVEDDGPGLPESANLFVPFFTTKPGGSGIGLALSRQIAEAHGATLTLRERADGRGTRAELGFAASSGR
ncbi:hypothetical protein BH23GEM4_BH23GEM4_07770 [soil metagenome]